MPLAGVSESVKHAARLSQQPAAAATVRASAPPPKAQSLGTDKILVGGPPPGAPAMGGGIAMGLGAGVPGVPPGMGAGLGMRQAMGLPEEGAGAARRPGGETVDGKVERYAKFMDETLKVRFRESLMKRERGRGRQQAIEGGSKARSEKTMGQGKQSDCWRKSGVEIRHSGF